MQEQFKNASATTLGSAITSTTATTITVADATQFPSSPQFRIIIDSELMLVTGISGNTLTVVRGAESSPASVHSNGAAVTHIVTVGALDSLGKDNSPWWNGVRPTFELFDANGDTLTLSSFTEYRTASDVGTPSLANQDRYITIGRPAGSGGPGSTEGLVSLGRPAPSTPYTVTLALVPMVVGSNGQFSTYVGWRESSSGKSVVLRIPYWYSGGNEYSVNTYTNETSAGFVNNYDYPLLAGPQWYQLSDNGTDISVAFGDGVNWATVYSQARGANFTTAPDTLVWGAGANANAFDNFATLLAWQE
jgi:hypothetical protein